MLTTPRRSASSGDSRSDSRYSCLARDGPTSWVKNQLPPKSPLAPIFENAVVMMAFEEAMRRSHDRAIDRPAPAAAPGMAAIVVFGRGWRARLTARWRRRRSSTAASTPGAAPLAPDWLVDALRAAKPLTSPPAQKAPPSPVTTRQ